MLYVKNTNSFVFAARYDGIDYIFPINEKVPVSPEAAAHIFAFGRDDKVACCTSHGWCKTTDKVQDGMNVLNRFVFNEDAPAPAEMEEGIPSFADRKKIVKDIQNGARAE